MKLAILQFKPRKGDVDANLTVLGEAFAQLAAEDEPYDLIVLPEAALTGYFLEGAVYELAQDAETFAARLAKLWRERSGKRPVDIVVGFYENAAGTYYNAAMYLRVTPERHEIVHVHRKMFLATYGVFDEERFLSRGRRLQAFDTRFGRMAILICEDAWHAIMPTIAAIKGARALIIPSASPGRGLAGGGELESVRYWREILHAYAVEHGVYIFYAGLAGFEGGKGMTGSSRVVDPRGQTLAEGPEIGPCIIRAEIDFREVDLARASLPLLGDLGSLLPDLLLDDELLPTLKREALAAKLTS
jgi:N-carbamoylputrescine amidase